MMDLPLLAWVPDVKGADDGMVPCPYLPLHETFEIIHGTRRPCPACGGTGLVEQLDDGRE